ncbi:MAG TPA: ROK family transcriptional regulator [Microbacteriaceae bacterium]
MTLSEFRHGAPHGPGSSVTGNTPRTPGFGRGRALRPSGKVLPEYARGHNRALVLQTLYQAGQLSRADIARETGLTRVTVSDLIGELIGDGVVVERGQREGSRPGKPATLLEIDRTAFQLIGIDLSPDDRFRGAVLEFDGTILSTAEVPLNDATGPDATGPDAIAKVIALLTTLQSRTTAPVLGVGVGSPGVVDLGGVVLSAPNLGWTDVPLQTILSNHAGVPVHVANDANVATLAEHTFGSAFSDFMLIVVGHGVGAGLLIDGTPLFGSRFAAGEIGHVVVGTDGGARCVCGKNGCLETWLSVPSIRAALKAAGCNNGTTSDQALCRDRILRDAGQHLGIAVAPVVAALNLAEIVLSGPDDVLDGPLAEAALETIRERTLPTFHGAVKLRTSDQGADIVLKGAAVLVLSAQLGVS